MAEASVVLVTGGAGYIGAHCCKAISAAGFLPVCLDNLSTGHAHFVKWGPLVVGDIAKPAVVETIFRSYKVAAVVHLAASSQVGESVADPQKYYLNNVVGSISLLRLVVEHGCKAIVFSSSGAVYGDAGGAPILEKLAGNTASPYGASKWIIEQVLNDYRRAYGLRSFSLRYFNASGADASGQIGELRDPETHLIPRAIMALQGKVGDFSVFGTDYATPDGTAIRDYIHVSDLAEAHVLALQALTRGAVGESFNLGTGAGYSVMEILAEIGKAAGAEVPYTVKARRDGDPPVLVADASAVQRELGFTPSSSDLPTIIKSAWNWHREVNS